MWEESNVFGKAANLKRKVDLEMIEGVIDRGTKRGKSASSMMGSM